MIIQHLNPIFLVLRQRNKKLLKYLSIFEKRVLFIALIIHLTCIWFSVGFHHPDEHYQLIEFANYKLGKTPLANLTWEYNAQMRPGLQAFMIYCLLKPYYSLGFSNPYHFALILRLISGLLAMFTAWQFHKVVLPHIKSIPLQKAHLLLSLLGWGLVYIHVRFSSENWSALAFTWAIIILWRNKKWHYWLFGLLMGLSFVFRFQAIFMIGGAGLWMLFIDRTKWENIGKVSAGFIVTFIVGLLCEYWLYGHWTISSWDYVHQNIVANKAAQYGIEPWYWYFEQIISQGLAPFSIVMLLSIPIIMIYKPKNILTWSMVFFLLAHVIVAHKEFRFLFPLYLFVPFWVVNSIEYLGLQLNKLETKKWYLIVKKTAWKAFWLANSIALLIIITKPAEGIIALNKVFYDKLEKETIIIYSKGSNPNINDYVLETAFYENPLLKSYCIDEVIDDTAALVDKNIWLFSEHAYPKDEFMFQYGGSFFDSTRSKVMWTNIPTWAYQFNFNNWLERSNTYTLYQLYSKPNP
jgi:GPI mannosyltransferase 3